MPFISVCCLTDETKSSSTNLKSNGESEHPCLVPDHRGKALSFSPLRMILAVSLSYMAFMMLTYVLSFLTLLRVFIKNGCCILSNAFSASIDGTTWFLPFFFLMFSYLFLRERENEPVSRGGTEREGDRENEAGSALSKLSPMWGSNS